jgi:PKD repeat protein/lysophospholipase L1-like esterase
MGGTSCKRTSKGTSRSRWRSCFAWDLSGSDSRRLCCVALSLTLLALLPGAMASATGYGSQPGVAIRPSLARLQTGFSTPGSTDSKRAKASSSKRGLTELSKLPLAAQSLVSRTVARGDLRYRATVSAFGLTIKNPRQDLAARFTDQGVRVRSGAARLGMTLRGYGYGKALRPLPPTAAQASGNRISYKRGSLVEWYENGPLGLEQGFTLRAPPALRAGGPLTLSLSISGNLRASLAPGRNGLLFATSSGPSSLRYRGVTAFGAGGCELRAWLELRGGRLLLRVNDAGARYPLTIDPLVQAAELTASDGAQEDFLGQGDFGTATVISADGSTIVAAAPYHTVGTNTEQGALYVFVRPSSGWANATETAELTASDGRAGEALGGESSGGIGGLTNGLVISADGSTIAAGNAAHTVNGNAFQGALYVFARPLSGWASETQTAELTGSDGGSYDYLGGEYYGGGLAISGDGSTIAAGRGRCHSGTNGQGALYVWVRPTTGWANATQTAELTASDGAAYDELGDGCHGYGAGVGLSADGSTIVGAASSHTVGTNVYQGALYVFVRPASGWVSATQTAELTASDGAARDGLGDGYWDEGFKLSADGSTIVAAAGAHKVGANVAQGALYVFVRPATGWVNATQNAELTASDGGPGDRLGESFYGGNLVISADGSTIAVSIAQAGPNPPADRGALYVFARPSNGWVNATQSAELTASDQSGPGDYLGSTGYGGHLGISADGSRIVAGATSHTVGSNVNQGALYVFDRPSTGWANETQTSELTACDGGAYGGLTGRAISDDGTTAVALSSQAANNDQGTIYVFNGSGLGCPPLVTTLAATSVTATSATLNGNVNPEGSDTSYHFEYGPTASYGSQTPAAGVGSGSGFAPVSAAVLGLSSGMTYHYRVVASNHAGTTYGGDQTFTALSLPDVSVVESGSGSGLVTSEPAGISCPAACSGSFAIGSQVALTARPSSESLFGGWLNDCAAAGLSPTCTVNVGPSGSYIGAMFTSRFAWLPPSPADGDVIDTSSPVPVRLMAHYDSSGLPPDVQSGPLLIGAPSAFPGFACSLAPQSDRDTAEVDCTWAPSSSDTGVHYVTFPTTLPDGGTGPSLTIGLGHSRYVALGDSYSSGEGVSRLADGDWLPACCGLPQQPGTDAPYWDPGTDRDLSALVKDHCHRSPYAYSRVLATMTNPVTGAPLTPGMPDFHACSGAITSDFYSPNHQWGYVGSPDVFPQLCWLDLNPTRCQFDVNGSVFPDRTITLVTLTDGGNDIGFAPVVQNCVLAIFSDSGCWGQDGAVNQAIAELEPKLVNLLIDIRRRAPEARILIGGYPKPFPSGGYHGPCYTFDITDEEWMNAKAAQLDFAIQQAASESGVAEYVDTYSMLDGHEVCDSGVQYINGILPPGYPDSFHPNRLGHAEYARRFAQQLEKPPGFNYSINPEQNLAITFNASGDGTATFSTRWPGSTIDVTLTDPNGHIFTGTDAQAGVTHVMGSTFDVYRVVNPTPGAWTIQLTGISVAPGGEPVHVQTTQLPSGEAGSLSPPSATATASPSAGSAPLAVTFKATSPSSAVSYRWLFGDGSTESGATVSHVYTTAGAYKPALIATGSNGLEAFVSMGTIDVIADATPPVIGPHGDMIADATGPAGAVVAYALPTATDPDDPVASLTCVPPSGSTFAIGTTVVTCTATDTHGNTASSHFAVHIKGANEQLADLLRAVNGLGPGKSLSSKVADAQSLLANGQTSKACLILTAFNLEVRAQSGKKIPAPQATALIVAANRIKTVLGCPN